MVYTKPYKRDPRSFRRTLRIRLWKTLQVTPHHLRCSATSFLSPVSYVQVKSALSFTKMVSVYWWSKYSSLLILYFGQCVQLTGRFEKWSLPRMSMRCRLVFPESFVKFCICTSSPHTCWMENTISDLFCITWDWRFSSVWCVCQADGLTKQKLPGLCWVCKWVMKKVKKRVTVNSTPVSVMMTTVGCN